jgi:hypothetical protein
VKWNGIVNDTNRLRKGKQLTKSNTLYDVDLFGILYRLLKKFKAVAEVTSVIEITSDRWKDEKTKMLGSENVSNMDYLQGLSDLVTLE